jgi:short subunit dehydrogenase-like uncharacterized protein
MQNRQYDVVLYGASGFVGQQTVQYFAQHVDPKEVKWAIAGRNRQKLVAVKLKLGAVGESIDILVADSHDQVTIDQMVSQTRVVLNTTGPFALYGTGIVDACVRFQTHYLDITGETPWVKDLILQYHDRAAADGTKIIPCSGFDSVPSDLGAYLVVRYMQRELSVSCRSVKAYFQMQGGFNGGTLASGFNMVDSGRWPQMRDPFLLNAAPEHSLPKIEGSKDPEWIAYDREIGTWVSPFFMGIVNTRVVRRSCSLYDQWQESYGENFTYQEYFKFDPPLAQLQAAGMMAGMILFAYAQSSPLRHLLQSYLPQPGNGPTEQEMAAGWFRCDVIGIATDGRRVRGTIADRGDPGNIATTKFSCESALSLVMNIHELPGQEQRGGVLTPATGLGDVLLERLREAGMTVDVQVL